MKISAKGRYAIRAMINIALNESKEPKTLLEISRHQGISLSYLEQLFALLRSAGAYQMFRKAEQNSIKPESVARFLLLDPIFPRSIRYCLDGISNTLKMIDTSPPPENPSELECMRGLLKAKWSYIRIEDIINDGLHEAIDSLQIDLNKLNDLIQEKYFIN